MQDTILAAWDMSITCVMVSLALIYITIVFQPCHITSCRISYKLKAHLPMILVTSRLNNIKEAEVLAGSSITVTSTLDMFDNETIINI